jgi:hypothetical protein
MKLNVKLLNRIKKHLLEEPKRYYQGWWAERVNEMNFKGEQGPPACNTQACIAGWAVLLENPKNKWSNLIKKEDDTGYFFNKAQKLLGLSGAEADSLFSSGNQRNWYGKFGVKEAIRKIDLLIKDREKFVKKYDKYI